MWPTGILEPRDVVVDVVQVKRAQFTVNEGCRAGPRTIGPPTEGCPYQVRRG